MSYRCPVCDVRLCFDNRCAFLSHIKSHGFDPDFLKPGDLCVLPLEAEESECASLFKQTSLYLSTCPVCSLMFDSIRLHFEGNTPGGPALESVLDSLICELCGYVSPSKCAASAHKRFHQGEPLCPDCGEIFLNSSSLTNHMKRDCLHNLKRTVFKCDQCCGLEILFIEEFFEHLISKHVKSVYKCHMCGFSGEHYDLFNSHRATEHNLPSVDVKKFTECNVCPGPLITKVSVEDHATCHATDRRNMFTVFQCELCQSTFASKALLIDHLPSCQSSKDPACNSSVIEGDNWSELFESTNTGQDRQTQSQLVASECALTSENASANDDFKMEQPECTPTDETLPEEKCEDDCKVNADTPLSPTNISPLKKSVVCKICRKVLCLGADKVLIKRHFSSEHFDIYMNAIHREVNGQQTNAAEDYVMKSDKEIVESFLKSFTNNGNVPKTTSKKQNLKKKKSKIVKVNETRKLGLKVPKLGPMKNVKKCYKCSFTSKDIRAFRSHIILHKSNASELQCPECGLCFIVRPALEKHLIAGHGIKNVGKFLSDNGFEEHGSEVELSDNEDQIINVESDSEVLQENQCKVCKKVFESAMLLKNHFRVHGGAFLLANLKAKRSNS